MWIAMLTLSWGREGAKISRLYRAVFTASLR